MSKFKPTLFFCLWSLFAGIAALGAAFAGMYLYLSPNLPTVETLRDTQLQIPLRIYSQDDKLIGQFGEKRRTPIAYNDIPKHFVSAILAAEDDRFFSHNGFDLKGFMRAVTHLIRTGTKGPGGSTITMQVARNYFLSSEVTFTRKLNEILLALQIERELTKQEILELYVNKIFLGNRAYGIQAASQVYYGKSIDQLTVAQLAMIAGIPKGPSIFNPLVNPERALTRRNWILERMYKLQFIDQETYIEASNEPLSEAYHGFSLDMDAPYASEMARKKVLELLGESAYTDGFKVYTTVNATLQKAAQEAVIDGLITYDERHGYRGPELQLQLQLQLPPQYLSSSTPEQTTNTTSENPDGNTATSSTIDTTPWIEALREIPDYGHLQAAVVYGFEDKDVKALLADGRIITIGWEQGLSNTRRYISENRQTWKQKAPSDFLAIGDVIRVQEKKADYWEFKQLPKAQAALVSLNPTDGAILSLVGGFDFYKSHFNRAIQAARQPGSNFKPFIYTTALEKGFTAASIINDAPIVFDDATLESTWRPENDSGKFYGPTRLRVALYNSRNLVSIRLLRNMGIEDTIAGLDRFGFDTHDFPHDLSLALGSHSLTPLQVATGYAVFANGGFRVEPYLISRIEDNNGEIVYDANPLTACNDYCLKEREALTAVTTDSLSAAPVSDLEAMLQAELEAELGDSEAKTNTPNLTTDADNEANAIAAAEQPSFPPLAPRVVDERVIYIMNSILKDVIQKGTGRKARVLERNDIAGKTGTTNGPRDAWFSGFNPDVVTTTWLGFDQNLTLGRNEYGGSAALPIWIDYMREALRGKPIKAVPQPDGLVTVRINPETGERAKTGDPDAIFETFRTEYAPSMTESSGEAQNSSNGGDTSPLPQEIF